MISLLKYFDIRFEYLDKNGCIVPSCKDFWDYLGMPMPSAPIPAEEVFPELVGLEKDILDISNNLDGILRLPSIQWNSIYFNIAIFSNADVANGNFNAIISIEDASSVMKTHQALAQERNAIYLLTHTLELKNAELSEANKKLDNLMNVVRLQNHELDLKVKLRTKKLHDSRLSLITTLAHVAEFRDTDTGGHIYRIGRSSVIIGKQYGLSTEECETLFYSSLLHDIGKIGIPDAILLKPGPLTPEEWKIMKDHTRIGVKILDRNEHSLYESARDVVLHHHERWDGKGYPDELKKDEISIMSRICSVADVFDALISERPYKKAFSDDESIEIIKKESGKAFDPDVVKAFFDVLPDIFAILDESKDIEILLPELE